MSVAVLSVSLYVLNVFQRKEPPLIFGGMFFAWVYLRFALRVEPATQTRVQYAEV
jgi:hypothetical protein